MKRKIKIELIINCDTVLDVCLGDNSAMDNLFDIINHSLNNSKYNGKIFTFERIGSKGEQIFEVIEK